MATIDAFTCDGGMQESLHLELEIVDADVLRFLGRFEDHEHRVGAAQEALRVGVVALQSASPTLDTRIVHEKFAAMQDDLRQQLNEFQEEFTRQLSDYFAEDSGAVPKKLQDLLGADGKVARTFGQFFDPSEGRLVRLLQGQIGPQSPFGKALDPSNRDGILSLIEAKVRELVEAKLDSVLKQFSLDDDQSAMSRISTMLASGMKEVHEAVAAKRGAAEEAKRGHVKGLTFEEDLYGHFARLCQAVGDESEFVRGTPGAIPRRKTGDFVSTLGEVSGAPGQRIVVEVKNTALRLKDAQQELDEAKKNRQSAVGIMVFAEGCQPPEVNGFHRVGDDFYCVVDKEALERGEPLTCFDAAYRIARVMVVTAVRKEVDGALDLERIHQNIDRLLTWTARLTDAATKARTVQRHGDALAQLAEDLGKELDVRLSEIQRLLRD